MDTLNNSTKIRVLVAEDDLTSQEFLKAILNAMPEIGSYIMVSNGLGVIDTRKNASHNFDVFFVDLELPGMNGVQVTKFIREHEKLHDLLPIPICLLTGHKKNENQEACYQAGVDCFINKPAHPEKIRYALHFMGLLGNAKPMITTI